MSADNHPKLDKVKRTGKGTWTACCPAHADKGPSLSIRETDDGRVLLHDFGAGCSAVDILAAVGLELRDLYPEPIAGHRKPERRPFLWWLTCCAASLSRHLLSRPPPLRFWLASRSDLPSATALFLPPAGFRAH